jgi:bacterioferritin-associated ferredoxin
LGQRRGRLVEKPVLIYNYLKDQYFLGILNWSGVVIICSCNVLTEKQVLETLNLGRDRRPRSAAQTYRCLGCAPRCGRCLETVRALVVRAHLDNCQVGCAECPAHEAEQNAEPAAVREPALVSAE